MKPELVIMRAIYEPAIADLARDFTVHRLWTQDDPERFLRDRGEQRARGRDDYAVRFRPARF